MEQQFLSDTELIAELQQFDKADRILIDIWDCEYSKAQIVATAMIGALPKLGESKTVRVCQFNMDIATPTAVKAEGQRIKKLLTKSFKQWKVKSNLHYR